MKNITENEVGKIIEEALQQNKKNILFVSHTNEDRPIIEWLDKHSKEYNRVYCNPLPLRYTNDRGFLQKVCVNGKEIIVIATEQLIRMNDKKSILFMNHFGNNTIYGFEKFMDIVKYRYYINCDVDGNPLPKYDVSKLGLLIAMTTGDDGGFELSKDNYEFFDDVYILEL